MAAPTLDMSAILRDMLSGGGAKGVRSGRDITAYEAIMGFYHAVTWSDPGVQAILCFHVLYIVACTCACLCSTGSNVELQGALFLLTCGLVYAASYINSYLSQMEGRVPRWRNFGFTQDYFDKQGVFMAHIYCAPLLLVAFAQMLFSLSVACKLLVKVKRAELRRNAKERALAEGGGGEGAQKGAAGGEGVAAPEAAAVAEPAAAKSTRRRRKD